MLNNTSGTKRVATSNTLKEIFESESISQAKTTIKENILKEAYTASSAAKKI